MAAVHPIKNSLSPGRDCFGGRIPVQWWVSFSLVLSPSENNSKLLRNRQDIRVLPAIGDFFRGYHFRSLSRNAGVLPIMECYVETTSV